MSAIWHYSCEHSAQGIARDGFLRPGADGFVWMTDLHPPVREALGLTMLTIKCDRMAYQWQVADRTNVRRWMLVRKSLPRAYVHGLESAPGARPGHWFISETNVPILRVTAEATS